MDGWTIRVLWHFEHADSGYIMPQFKQRRLETVQEFWQMTLKSTQFISILCSTVNKELQGIQTGESSSLKKYEWVKYV